MHFEHQARGEVSPSQIDGNSRPGAISAIAYFSGDTSTGEAIACFVFMLGLTLRESGPANARTKATIALGLGAFAVLASFVVLLIG